jgi:Cytidine and deoxycytidylate deaminase zinc-binding region
VACSQHEAGTQREQGETLRVDLAATETTEAPDATFHIPAARVAELAAASPGGDALTALLGPSSSLARPPISRFRVGAVGLTRAGDAFVGVNLEFARMPLHCCVHAEQFLIANLRRHGRADLVRVAVNAAPCGHCRCDASCLAPLRLFTSRHPCGTGTARGGRPG